MSHLKRTTNALWIAAVLTLSSLGAGLATPAAAAEAAAPRIVDVTVTDKGYEPSRIELAQGERVRVAFHQEAKSSCAHTVKSPELGLELTALPPGETTVVEISPPKTGEFTFVCSMDMLQGSVIVEAPKR